MLRGGYDRPRRTGTRGHRSHRCTCGEYHPLSPELRNIKTRQIIAALERDGFQKTRQTGSHAIYRRGDRKVMVAIHSPGATIPIGILNRIIADAGWTEEDLRRLKIIG
ncbi:MAG: type II toxin-antitoxin system HicA family toxin [Dehalococcoidia bacterium]